MQFATTQQHVSVSKSHLHMQAVAHAEEFQTQWPTHLQLFRNDCRNHTNQLVARLTGVQNVMAHLPVTRRPRADRTTM